MKVSQSHYVTINTFSIFCLLIIWVLPGTIALRNILIFSAAVSAVGIIYSNWEEFKFFRLSLAPIYLIIGLFIWVFIHYIYFSTNPELEFSEIKGLWVRALASAIAALGFSIVFCTTPSARKYLYMGILSVPLINIISYLYASYLNGSPLNPGNFIFFLFAKIETAFYGALGGAIVVSTFAYYLVYKKSKINYIYLVLNALFLILIVVSDTLSTTLNGLLIIFLLLTLLFLLALLKNLTKLKDAIKRNYVSAIFFSLASLIILVSIYGPVSSKFNHYLQDVQIGFNIDGFDEWRILRGEGFQPLNSHDKPVTLNVYYRAAFAAMGIRLIPKYPLGYGSINESFNRLQTLEGELHLHTGQVHSGWIDFGLAFGLPGLALILSALVGALYLASFLKTREGMLAAFLCITLILFGLLAELAYKQYFEMLIFFITFSCGLVFLQKDRQR